MNTSVNNTAYNVNNNAAKVASNNNAEKINDFGQKIGGARKDLYAAAHEWADQLADITAEKLAGVGLSKLVRLPNLEGMTEAGAISGSQARAALTVWRTIERKPQGDYRASRWAERTREKLQTVADILTGTADDIPAEVLTFAEYQVLTAANWPAVAFSFGKYSVNWSRYSEPMKLRIQSARYYEGNASTDPADIVAQLRAMVARDDEKSADRRAAGPALSIYVNRVGIYFIAPVGHTEIVLQSFDNKTDALKAYYNDRPALVARYQDLKSFPACRRDWNRPRVGEDWRQGENMTPEAFAAVLPFRGVEFGNWVNQTERAALLNSAFDGFHDLAAVLNIAPAAVTLNGSLAFAFASRGHSGAAAHYEPARRVINLTKKSGAGCMAHEWFHAVDNFAAGGGVHNYATEHASHPKAHAILKAIEKTAYYTRSKNLAAFKGDYWTSGRELTARAFEGVCAVMLNAAGICSDFLVNCKSMDEFTAEDVARRSDYYPYPTAQEAAALLPLYVDFLREVFGNVLTAPAEALAAAEAAARQAEADRIEAERLAAERAAREKEERERKARERAEAAAREAEARQAAAAKTIDAIKEVLTARHFDTIATGYDAAAVYAVAHLEGHIFTLCADIKTANDEGRAYVEGLPLACTSYKYIHNAKRIICRRYQAPEIRANKRTAAELVAALSLVDCRDIWHHFDTFAKVENIDKAAQLYADATRAHEEADKRANGAKGTTTKDTKKKTATAAENGAPADGLQLVDIAGGVAVVGNDWKDTFFNKRHIKAHGAKWNDAAKQWQATDPADVATLRAWFALRDEPQTATANEAPQAPANDAPQAEPANELPALPEWLKVGARVRTAGRYMISARSMRPEWVDGEEMEVTEITPDFVSLKSDTARESIATATAAAALTPCYSTSEISQPAEVAADYAANHHGATLTEWDKQHPAPVAWCKPGQCFKSTFKTNGAEIYGIITKLGKDCYFYIINAGNTNEHLAAYEGHDWTTAEPVNVLCEDTPKFARMFATFRRIRQEWESTHAKEWEQREQAAQAEAVAASRDTNDDTEPAPAAPCYSTSEKSEPAAVFTSSATDEEKAAAPAAWMERAPILENVVFNISAPWHNGKKWLCPYFGARDVWAEHLGEAYRGHGHELEEWALTAHLGDTATFNGLTLTIWERDGHSMDDPEPAPAHYSESEKSGDTTASEPAPRLKSCADLYAQHDRIFDALARADWDGHEYTHKYLRRIQYINTVLNIYKENINKYFNVPAGDYMSNEQHAQKLTRDTYAAAPACFSDPAFYEEPATDEKGHRIKTSAERWEQYGKIDREYITLLMKKAHALEISKGIPAIVAAYTLLRAHSARLDEALMNASREAGKRRRRAYILERMAREWADAGEVAASYDTDQDTAPAVNTYAKFCPNVYVAKCPDMHEKGDIIEVTTKHGKKNEHIIYNLVASKDGYYYYSIVRADGYNLQERARRKAEQLEQAAENADKRSRQYWDKSQKNSGFLSLGEPIKIGHHSEARHRKAINDAWENTGRAVREMDKADNYRERAESWRNHTEDINLSIPESLDYYREKLEQAKKYHADMKAGKIEREHAFSLNYAKKALNDAELNYKRALRLWGPATTSQA